MLVSDNLKSSQKFIKTRMFYISLYLLFIDYVNKQYSETYKNHKLKVRISNLYFSDATKVILANNKKQTLEQLSKINKFLVSFFDDETNIN